MRFTRVLWLTVAVFSVPGLLCAQQDALRGPAPTSRTHLTTNNAGEKTETHAQPQTAKASSEMQALRHALDVQQQQIQQLREELQKRDETLQQMQQQLGTLQSVVLQTQRAAQTEETGDHRAALAQVNATLASLSTTEAKAAAIEEQTEKSPANVEHPAAINYKGITITPGGFAALYGIWRRRNTGSDATSSFSNFPFSGTSNANLSEFRFTARHSNLNIMGQGTVRGLKTTAYFEMDFEGAANSNEVISSSFNPRIREFWANVETKTGWSVLAGQTWSLLTANRKGIAPKSEFRPATIDASYLVGYHYARLGSVRLTRKVSDKFAAALAVENPEVVQVNGPATAQAGFVAVSNLVAGVQGSGFSAAPSTDAAPDLVGKVAFDPGWGHYEIGAIGRFFRSRLAGTVRGAPNSGTTMLNEGGGGVLNVSLPLVPKKVDFIVNALAGRGVGRYAPGGGPDVIVKPDGSLMPVKSAVLLFGFETHPTPNVDFNLYGGNEYYGRTVYGQGTTSNPFVGYGPVNADLRGCSVERPIVTNTTTGATASCNAVNRDIWEITPVFWHRVYKGREGTLQWGIEYEYIHRRPWSGNGPTPVGIENVAFTGVRWYFP